MRHAPGTTETTALFDSVAPEEPESLEHLLEDAGL